MRAFACLAYLEYHLRGKLRFKFFFLGVWMALAVFASDTHWLDLLRWSLEN